MSDVIIEINAVTFAYEKENIINNINIEIERGEFVAVLGENGSGKTTLIKLINGINKPDSGEVSILGMNTKNTKMSKIAREVGFLYQNPDRQICQNTVEKEIAFGMECVGYSKKDTSS